jgi:UDP-galactopyranose mutase
MLVGARIELGVDYLLARDYWDAQAKTVVFTGCLDQFYGYRYGQLDYRTLRFETLRENISDYQGNAVINYTGREPYTRVVEHKHFAGAQTPHTLVTWEYPEMWQPDSVPYYPINDDKNSALYAQYAALARQETKYLFGGRLAEFRYYDMHQVIGSALTSAAQFLGVK